MALGRNEEGRRTRSDLKGPAIRCSGKSVMLDAEAHTISRSKKRLRRLRKRGKINAVRMNAVEARTKMKPPDERRTLSERSARGF